MKNYIISASLLLMAGAGILQAQGVKIMTGAQLLQSGNAKLVLNNAGLVNNGTFTPGTGSVIFTGSSSLVTSAVSGSSATSFYDLELNKSANGMQLGQSVSISHLLRFTSGDSLFLNGYTIDLGSTGSISGETGASRITGRTGGYVQSTQVLNAPVGNNPGNMGFYITSAANLGSTVIKRGHQQQSGASVYRYYEVTPTVNTGLNAAVRFYYFDEELAGLAEPNLGMFSSSDGNNWVNNGEDGMDQTANYILVNGLDQLNRITLATISAPLSVKFISFTALARGNEILLNWKTTDEIGNSYYILERSADGNRFQPIAELPATGGVAQVHQYMFADRYTLAGRNIYRVKQVDMDGKFSYSWTISLDPAMTGESVFTIYPNPLTGDNLNMTFSSAVEQVEVFRIYNNAGTLLRSIPVSCQKGIQVIAINTTGLPGGIYFISKSGQQKGIRFIKQ